MARAAVIGIGLISLTIFACAERRGDEEFDSTPRQDTAAVAEVQLIDVGGYDMRIRSFGLSDREPGEPLVIFENGSVAPLESWADVPMEVAERAPVLLYDRSTVGGSEWDGEVGAPTHVTERLWSLLEELDAPPPYVLVGWSWGADLIRYHASTHPNDVIGLVYVDAAAHSPAAELALMEQLGFGREGLQRKIDFLARQAKRELSQQQAADIQYIDDLLAAGLEHNYGDVPDVPAVALVAGQRRAAPNQATRDTDVLPLGRVEEHRALLPGKIDRVTEWIQGSSDGVLIFVDKSQHHMQGQEPALVIMAINRILDAAEE